MAESQVRSIFGIHDIRFYNRDTMLSVAHYRVIGEVSIEFAAEFAELKGGSNLFVWDAAISKFDPKVSITARELTDDIIDMNVSGSSTAYAADSAGDVIEEANVNGTSVLDAVTGIASVSVVAGTGAADLKEGWYVIKALGADTVDVYALSSANFARGTDKSYEDDDGKITASALTVATGATVAVPGFGIELTGGSGVIGMTAGDTMTFYVQKPHGGAYATIIGAQPMEFDEYGCIITSEDNAGVIHSMRLYRVKPAGQSFPFKEKDYGEFNVNLSVMYDSTLNRVAEFRQTTPE